jgi:hypothetical protein
MTFHAKRHSRRPTRYLSKGLKIRDAAAEALVIHSPRPRIR